MLVTDQIAELEKSVAHLEEFFKSQDFKNAATWEQKEYRTVYDADAEKLAEKRAYYLEHKEVFDSYVQPKTNILW